MIQVNNNKHIDMSIHYLPYQRFKDSKLVNNIFFYQNDLKKLQELINSNLNQPNNYSILLTFFHGLNKYYNHMCKQLIKAINNEIKNTKCYQIRDIFQSFPLTSCILKAILDNTQVDKNFKCLLLTKFFNNLLLNNNSTMSGFFYTSFLDYIYSERKTISIPILAIKLLFKQVNFSLINKYAINNFMLDDYFIQFLNNYEINNSFPILLNKKGLQQWLNHVHINSYIYLLSRLSKFLPYKFTQQRLLPAVKDDFNNRILNILLTLDHLTEQDYLWLQSYKLLKKL